MIASAKDLERYLERRAVQGPWKIEPRQQRRYAAAIIIPALAEALNLPRTLKCLAASSAACLDRTLVLVVINNRGDCDPKLRHDNAVTLQWLQQQPITGLNLAWVDAFSSGHELPRGQGVGLARKIGFDLALPLLDWSEQPFLVSLDADSLVSNDYLRALFAHFATTKAGGAVLPFRHQPGETPAQEQAIRRYELYLRSYSYGLQLAGSPYAYNAIGSAMACSALAYLQIGGMNRRLAGEDFYFLQQLAKTVGVARVEGGLVSPSPRESVRVPFGTGRAISRQLDGGEAPFSFIPQVDWQILKDWLTLATSAWQSGGSEILNRAEAIDKRLAAFLAKLNFVSVWARLQANYGTQQQFEKAFHGWFDGLRTRQLLTSLDGPLDNNEFSLVNELLAWGGQQPQPDSESQLALLERLQGLTP